MMHRIYISIILLLPALFAQGQFIKEYSAEQKKELSERLFSHVSALAHDSMQGRESGTEGELMAMYYIANYFKNTGLQTVPEKGYWIPFTFSEGNSYSSGKIVFHADTYELNKHFNYLNQFVNYSFTGNAYFAGMGLKPDDYSKFDTARNSKSVIIIDINYSDTCGSPAKCTDYLALVESAVVTASQKNPEAIILVSSDFKTYPLPTNIDLEKARSNVPVLSAGVDLSYAILKNPGEQFISQCEFTRNEKTGYNVAAYIDNFKPTTIVFGAHYDHLGLGASGSLSGDKAIHNGADDNASGTALMMELARYIYENEYSSHNYLFVAFGAEEKGLLGSKKFLDQNNFTDSTIIAMLNFDMVGRMDTAKPVLNIIGTGTAVQWDSLITASYAGPVSIKKSESGIAGSDQMSFYLKNIPVLFFITGMHEDYHKPSDDAEKINSGGMAEVMLIASNLVIALNGQTELTFRQTDSRVTNSGKRPGVTLGVIPDHAWDGKGMRIDNVTTGKTADKAGLLKGDIVIMIDDQLVTDIMSYMKALSGYKKGDKAKITYLRGEIQNMVEVVF